MRKMVFFIILVFVIIIFFIVWNSKERKNKKNQLLLKQKKLLKEDFKVLLEQNEQDKEKHQDAGNHLQNDICNNDTINAILHNKVKVCQSNSIKLEINLSYFISGRVENIDWISLFCSLFDNAIECCVKLERKEERFITLRSHYRSGYQILNLVYAKPGKQKSNSGLSRLKSYQCKGNLNYEMLRETVKKYEGIIEFKEEERIFHTIVSLRVETE